MKLVILDRDGVINEDSDAYIKSPEEWIPIPGSPEAVARLKGAGYTLVVATNQSGIARGYYDLQTLEAIHRKMEQTLEAAGGSLDGIFFCPHGPDDGCDCRKPKPGLLLQIADAFDLDLQGVPVIGDSLRDLQSADAVGARGILVLTGKGSQTARDPALDPAVPVYDDLARAVDALLEENRE
jgi:D-glycero-D-manno-heptose 1,7-bisphosphate phosphatase